MLVHSGFVSIIFIIKSQIPKKLVQFVPKLQALYCNLASLVLQGGDTQCIKMHQLNPSSCLQLIRNNYSYVATLNIICLVSQLHINSLDDQSLETDLFVEADT